MSDMSEWTLDELNVALEGARRARKAAEAELEAECRRHAAVVEELTLNRDEARAEELRLDRERRKLVYGS